MKKLTIITLCLYFGILTGLYFISYPLFVLVVFPLTCSVVGFLVKCFSMFKATSRHEFVENEKERQIEMDLLQNQKWEDYYDKKVYPTYIETRTLFTTMMQNREINKNQLIALVGLLNSRLGSFSSKYSKYKFENKAHEFYAKFKNKGLTYEDVISIQIALEQIRNEKLKCAFEKKRKKERK